MEIPIIVYIFGFYKSIAQHMQVILGIIFHFIGGFASGSFYMPFKKVGGWHWETFWLIGGLFSWLIVPPIAACLTVPGFTNIISHSSSSTLGYTFLFGLLWGFGGLTYGLGVRYLGMSLATQSFWDSALLSVHLYLLFITIFILLLAKPTWIYCFTQPGVRLFW